MCSGKSVFCIHKLYWCIIQTKIVANKQQCNMHIEFHSTELESWLTGGSVGTINCTTNTILCKIMNLENALEGTRCF